MNVINFRIPLQRLLNAIIICIDYVVPKERMVMKDNLFGVTEENHESFSANI
jgi:hypothetical protein